MTVRHVQQAGTARVVVQGIVAGALLVVIVAAVGSALLWGVVRGLLLLAP